MARKHHEKPYRKKYANGRIVWLARATPPGGTRKHIGTFKLRGPCGETGRGDCCAQHAIDAAYAEWEKAPAGARTFGEYAADWTDRWPRSARTDATNDHRIGRVIDVEVEGRPLRDWPIVELRRSHTRDLIGHMLTKQGRSVSGALNIVRALSALGEDAIADGQLPEEFNPFKGVRISAGDKRATKKPREHRIWSFEEMHGFAAEAGPYEPMIRMLSDCAFRIGELLGLQRALQDLQEGVFRVKGSAWNGQLVESSITKNHDREGPIPPGCLALLRAMPKRIDTPWLFSTPGGRRIGNAGRDRPGGALWRYDNWRRDVWLPTCVAAGIKPTPQEFRVSMNTHLLAAGIDRADLADLLGHSEDVNRDRYTRALRRSGDAIRAAIG